MPRDQRDALEELRRTIRAMVPKAEECISYGLAAFRLEGRVLVGFGASAKHCGFRHDDIPSRRPGIDRATLTFHQRSR